MEGLKRQPFKQMYWMSFIIIVLFTLTAYGFYGSNMFRWKDNVDFGWRTMYDSGPNVVAEVFKSGEQAGLRAGDTVKAINGKPYSTFDELFFVVRNYKIDGFNSHSIVRGGESFEINVHNSVIGTSSVLKRSGPLFAIGLLYVFIGVLVFMMKPVAEESLVFLLMTVSLGVSMSYSSPADLMRPFWLFDVRQFVDVIIPAPLIYLALIFPRRHKLLEKWTWLWIAPFLISFILYFLYQSLSTAYWDSPPLLNLINNFYLLFAVIIFITSMVWNIVKGTSVVVRLQSQVIFIGILLGFFIPSTELLLRNIWDFYLISDPAIGFAIFFSVFPLSIGYTIVKHDLFAIDVIVRRTYGYILSTAAIVGVYGIIVSGLNLSLQFQNISRSPAFSLIFALVVVFTFRPLHARIQALVDRVFYRQKYDYRKTIRDMSQSLLRIFDPDQIRRTLIGSVVAEMALENGVFMQRLPEEQFFCSAAIEPVEREKFKLVSFNDSDAIVGVLGNNGSPVFRHDIDLDPDHEKDRDDLQGSFKSLESELMLPLMYKGEFRGIVSLGRKKSGKMFTVEDMDLLETIINQAAVALENTRLVDRIVEEEADRANLARYLSPQVVEQVLNRDLVVDLGGDRKEVTVLFSDIRGFTSLSESRPPDQLISILNEYFTQMARIIFKNQGSLDKYVGDAIVAVFGSLVDVENPALHAVNTAVDMMKAMPEMNRRWAHEFDGFSMDIGIGINTGEVFAGNIGSPERMEFTVIGDTVNIASRLSGVAQAGQIILTEDSVRKIDSGFSFTELPPTTLRGKKKEIKVFGIEY